MWDTFYSHSAYIQITLYHVKDKPRTLLSYNEWAFQNLVSEHSVEGVPTSLYNPTKSVPDPWIYTWADINSKCNILFGKLQEKYVGANFEPH